VKYTESEKEIGRDAPEKFQNELVVDQRYIGNDIIWFHITSYSLHLPAFAPTNSRDTLSISHRVHGAVDLLLPGLRRSVSPAGLS
jgi:hypothetical protein